MFEHIKFGTFVQLKMNRMCKAPKGPQICRVIKVYMHMPSCVIQQSGEEVGQVNLLSAMAHL